MKEPRLSTAQTTSIYRCFLPDLAGFESAPCIGPGLIQRASKAFIQKTQCGERGIRFSLANIVFALSTPPALTFAASCVSCEKCCDTARISRTVRSVSNPISLLKLIRIKTGFNNAERGGFEPPVRCRTQPFQDCTIDHSDISPKTKKRPNRRINYCNSVPTLIQKKCSNTLCVLHCSHFFVPLVSFRLLLFVRHTVEFQNLILFIRD